MAAVINQKWLDMAVLDLQESKQTGAFALEHARVLMMEKEILKEKLRIHLDLWDMDKRQLEEAVCVVKRDQQRNIVVQEYEIASLKVSMGFQQQEALCFKLRLEQALDDVDLLSSRLHILGLQLQEKDKLLKMSEDSASKKPNFESNVDSEDSSQKEKALLHQEDLDKLTNKYLSEVKSLKKEQSALSAKHKQEVSALLREKNFVWNQLKMMEDDYCSRLNRKGQELKVAEEDIQKLQSKVEELQRAHDEKTVEATVLKISVQTVEEELHKLRGELASIKSSEIEVAKLHNVNGSKIVTMKGSPTDLNGPAGEQRIGGDVKNQEAESQQGSQDFAFRKEEELKKAWKVMEELRLENQNLRMLYADLEAQIKQKPEKHNNRECGGKTEATRNLTAELDAVASRADDDKASHSLACTKALESDQENQSNGGLSTAQGRKRPASENSKLATRENQREVLRLRDANVDGRSAMEATKELSSSLDDASSCQQRRHTSLKKNRLFSSVFGIPKVLSSGT